MEVISITGVDELSQKLSSLSDRVLVLFFYIENSAECNQMSDIIAELQNDEKNNVAAVIKINAANNEEICRKYKVTSAPAFVFINSNLMGGDVVDILIGADGPKFSKIFEITVKQLQEFKDRLKGLINQAPVMLFMKGNPDTPRCGFSKQVIALLENHKANYKTFDILEDFEVREGLKKFSDWPTYPQLYVKGELIGGLDILKQHEAAGELDEILSGE